MRKFFMTMMLMFSMFIGLNAQTAIQTSKVFDNVYVGAAAGVYAPLDFDNVLPVNPALGVRVGKNFSPVIGVFVEDQVFFGNNHFAVVPAKNIVRANNLTLNGELNVVNLFDRFDENRAFDASVVGGIGWMYTFNPGIKESTYKNNFLTARTGVKLNWTVGKTKASQLFVEPEVLWNLTANHGVKFNKRHAQLGVVVGYIYRFKTSNGTHNFKTYDITALNNEINMLREELAKKPLEVEKVVEKEVVKEVEKVVEVPVGSYVVYFAQGSYDLSDLAKQTLDGVPAGATVYIKGYASPEGSVRVNQTLSENRATAVADYLRNRGLSVDGTEGFGKTGDIQNRVAVITLR